LFMFIEFRGRQVRGGPAGGTQRVLWIYKFDKSTV
jgi:hypothetical protein